MKALAKAAATAILKSSSLRIMLQPQWTILKALGLLPLSSKNAHHSSSLRWVLLVQEAEEKKRPITSFLTMYSKIRQQNDDDQSTMEREKNVGEKGHKRPPSFP